MKSKQLDEKIITIFGDLSIDKALVRSLKVREKRAITSFVEEWLISRFQHSNKTNAEISYAVTEFMSKHLPAKTEKEIIKHQLLLGNVLTILDRYHVRIDISGNRKILSIPCIEESNARIIDQVIEKNLLLLDGGLWGAGRLHVIPDNNGGYVVEMIDFNPMQSGKVRLDKMIEARTHFSTREWIYLLLRTMGYEPFSYTHQQQDNLILRLLPLIQNNINMMELAPKGTGKSFIYSNLSRYTWVNSGGALTQAQLFKNMTTKEYGLIGRYDLLVLDEGQSIKFKGAEDIHAKFKDYLESGHYSIGGDKVTSECGMMILANIDLNKNGMPRRQDYIRHLPPMFHDSALIDRFHGIIAGWEIPRFTTDKASQGMGIKADVFGEYLHQLRLVSHAEFPFGECQPLKGDTRDVKAVTRLASALSKLLLINSDHEDFEEYVLNPAKSLRQRVRSQLAELDSCEFSGVIDVAINN